MIVCRYLNGRATPTRCNTGLEPPGLPADEVGGVRDSAAREITGRGPSVRIIQAKTLIVSAANGATSARMQGGRKVDGTQVYSSHRGRADQDLRRDRPGGGDRREGRENDSREKMIADDREAMQKSATKASSV